MMSADNRVIQASFDREVVGMGYSKKDRKWFLREDFLGKDGELHLHKTINGTRYEFEREINDEKMAASIRSQKSEKMVEKYTAKELGDVANTVWQQVFQGQICSMKSGSLAQDDVYFTGYSVNSKTQLAGRIMENDPMSLRLRISNEGNGILIEPISQFFTVNPESPHMAYGSEKIGLRKAVATDLEDLSDRLFELFGKVKEKAVGLAEQDMFSVHEKRQPEAYQALMDMVQKPVISLVKGQVIEADDTGFTLKTKQGNVEIPLKDHGFNVKDRVSVKVRGDEVIDARIDRNVKKGVER